MCFIKIRYVSLSFLLLLVLHVCGCARKGLVAEKYSEDFYKVPHLLPDQPVVENQHFIVYSDNQSGWRVQEIFLKRDNWTNRKMFILPFYQLYLIGNGLVGAVNWFRHVPDYGENERRIVIDAIYNEAKRSDAAFVLSIGDMSAHDGRRPSHWGRFLKEHRVESPLLDEIPYLPVVGNHENSGDVTFGLPNYEAVFDRPLFYVVEFKDAALFVLNSNYILDQKDYISGDLQEKLFEEWFVSGERSERKSWLETQLAKYDKPFKIVAMHHPPITCAEHGKDWYRTSYGNNLEEKRAKLLGLFEKHGVQLVLSGHDHLYQHNILNCKSGKKLHLLTLGGGGTPLRGARSERRLGQCQRDFLDGGLDVTVAEHEEIFHYLLVDIDKQELAIRVVEITGDKNRPTELFETISIGPNQNE